MAKSSKASTKAKETKATTADDLLSGMAEDAGSDLVETAKPDAAVDDDDDDDTIVDPEFAVKEAITDVSIQVPFDPSAKAIEFPIHCDFRLSGEHATTLRRICLALQDRGVKLNNDREIAGRYSGYNNTLRYLIEQVAAAAGLDVDVDEA